MINPVDVELDALTTKQKVLIILEKNINNLISGEKIGKELNISRNSVWKAIKSLQSEGYDIISNNNEGYIFKESFVISEFEIRKEFSLNKSHLPYLTDLSVSNKKSLFQQLIFLETVDSTNTFAKENAQKFINKGTIIFAKEQTKGRGRLSRSFISTKNNGMYFSLLIKPNEDNLSKTPLTLEQISFVTLIAAVSVHSALSKFGDFDIKWPNDILYQGKKLCGILTECSVEGESGHIEYFVVGFGINLLENPDFPEEIKSVATSIEEATDKKVKINPARLLKSIVQNFEEIYSQGEYINNKKQILKYYKKHLYFLNQEIRVIKMNDEYLATAIDIDSEGRLIIKRKDNDKTEILNSGEISVRAIKPII